MRAAAAAAKKTQFAPGAGDAAALKKLAKQAGDAAQLLKLLANEKRLLILCFLAVRGEMTVGELVGVVKLSQSALSQHLAKLRAFGLVDTRRDGQMVYYFCSSGAARELLSMLDGFLATERPLTGPGPHYVAERLRRARAA